MINCTSLSRKRTFFPPLLAVSLLALLTLSGCKDQEPSGTTYIYGKIINPKADYVILTDYEELRDTVHLDRKGNFARSYEQLASGLYSISYPGEYQSFYIETGDSLGMRANTKAFDETLAFTGSHNKENDYLIKLFGQIEKSNMRLLKYKNAQPAAFLDAVDEIKEKRLKQLKKASDKYDFSKRFIDYSKQVIQLNSYYELERYPLISDSNPYKTKAKFPDGFFNHRKEIDVNQPKLLNNYAYRPFVNAMVSNMALKKMSAQEVRKIDLKSYDYNKHRLQIIDSIFKNDQLQNYFAGIEIRNFIRGRKNAEDINKLVTDFLEVSSNEGLNENIAQLAATYANLDPGNTIPNFFLRNIDNETVALRKQISKLSVLFFWSIDDKNYAYGIHDQVADLQRKYPDIEFIGINIDNLDYDQWQDAIAMNDLKNTREFQIVSKSLLDRQLALRNSNRSLVVDSDLTIIDPNINLFHYKIETTLLGYINR